mmetsp:Transcript_148982/g.285403  ORF Transcript_148982/g.285403 Transcript_148982/m.285403 type:complete len:311 (-) Transcript_148982:62-994(-)
MASKKRPASALADAPNPVVDLWHAKRKLLPERIILIRHGESEGNADHTLYRTKADNLIELTENGSAQAIEVGKRIKALIGESPVVIHVSPFQRTLQTARNARSSFEHQVRHVHVDPRIREQEFGNLQGDDFKKFREEQQQVGRFFYRFPTGESGGDVYDRTVSWWQNLIHKINDNPTRERVDTVLVFTHGLTIRFILMQLYSWSPQTFHTVWNGRNCAMYVLKKDLSSNETYPYKLDPNEGDMPESTAELHLKLKNDETKVVVLKDYLSVPPPRTRRHDVVAKMIHDQHGIHPSTIESIDFFAGKFKKFK